MSRQEKDSCNACIRGGLGQFRLSKSAWQHGNSVKVILGGNDGVLVTVDANGKIKVTPPEGPGDPETFGSDQIDISECADTWGKASSSDLPGIV